ncbi:hypothetical protein CEXT_270451 [Caerostris extrusa]|uniref:Uncharacterized protein n=1 Tax=Caerostris extrusa TaxID=172846 RepID=A0AAV4XS82_CAEEX|nr:hypothetical protein CEXT_270451 [Caerostris extrusa]
MFPGTQLKHQHSKHLYRRGLFAKRKSTSTITKLFVIWEKVAIPKLYHWNDWRNFGLNLSVANFQRQKKITISTPSPSPKFSPYLYVAPPFPPNTSQTIPDIYPLLKVASA